MRSSTASHGLYTIPFFRIHVSTNQHKSVPAYTHSLLQERLLHAAHRHNTDVYAKCIYGFASSPPTECHTLEAQTTFLYEYMLCISHSLTVRSKNRIRNTERSGEKKDTRAYLQTLGTEPTYSMLSMSMFIFDVVIHLGARRLRLLHSLVDGHLCMCAHRTRIVFDVVLHVRSQVEKNK